MLVDGAAHRLELVQKEAARPAVTIHVVLDIVHVIEKLWASARCFHTAAEIWAGFKAARILALATGWPIASGILIGNGDFPQYWTFHTHRERERLYPRPDQHTYELPA
ncbi:MAG TPA: hypothetical protein VIU15_08475 [Streptomyces sp.]